MEKKEEVEKAWVNRANSVFVRPTRQTEYYLKGIEDFKLALRAEIEKKFVIAGIKRDYLTVTIAEILSLIDEAKPLEK